VSVVLRVHDKMMITGQLGSGSTLDIGDEPNEMGDNLTMVDFGGSLVEDIEWFVIAAQCCCGVWWMGNELCLSCILNSGAMHCCAVMMTSRQLICWGYGCEWMSCVRAREFILVLLLF